MELAYHGVADAALAEVCQAYGAAVLGSGQILLEMLEGELVDGEHAFALGFGTAFVGSHLALLDFNTVFTCEPAYCLDIRHAFQVDEETQGRTGLAATETLEYTLCAAHRKRGRTVVVERAQAPVVSPALFQGHEIADDIDNVGGIHNTVDGLLVNS